MNTALQTENNELKMQVSSLSAEVSHLKLIVAKYKHMLFGKKSEKRKDYVVPNQLWLFPLPELETPQDKEAETIEIASHTRAVKPKFAEDDEAPEGTFPEHFPRHEEVIDEKPEGVAETDLELITSKVTERLEATPQEYRVIRIVRRVYKVKSTGKFHTPDLPHHVLNRRCKVSEGFIVLLIINKFLWHLPLYRQQQQLKLQGIKLSRDSLTKWVIELGSLLAPVAKAISHNIRGSPVVHVDETPMRVGKKKEHEKKKFEEGYFWPILAEGVGVSFVYRPSRSWKEVEDVLRHFTGVLVSDAYQAYEEFVHCYGLNWQLCWMHIRRYFVDVEKSNAVRAEQALSYIQALYKIEKDIKGKRHEERRENRLKYSKPVLEEFYNWLVTLSAKPEAITDELLSKAISYVLPRWDAACFFLNDGAIPLDNGKAERAIRPSKLGMKNWLHCASEEGAETAAVFYALIGSALMLGIHPYYYLLDLTKRLDDPTLKADDLTPAKWKLRFYEEAVPEHLRSAIKPGEPSIGGPKTMRD